MNKWQEGYVKYIKLQIDTIHGRIVQEKEILRHNLYDCRSPDYNEIIGLRAKTIAIMTNQKCEWEQALELVEEMLKPEPENR